MIVLDIETSGLDPQKHGILSIGAIDLRFPSRRFYEEARLHDNEAYDPEAGKINGISEVMARDRYKQSRQSLLRNFAEWYESRPVKVIAGLHIQAFDVPFLSVKAEQSRVALVLRKRSIDLHSLAYAKMLSLGKVIPLTNGWSVMDTDFIHPFCGLPKEPRPHNALHGAMWEAESMHRLIYGKPLLKEFSQYTIPVYLIE
ncbi:hypothetical protein KC878_00720 [Candidatus Saccharibacteria bacterium]|nr:hypothetical protein [Candidatus Saccharibacteria bacterium]MCB9821526.1 hypothetical protein [Candidatus Nomurabacteria bacterium]